MTRNFIKLLAATTAFTASMPVFAQDAAPQAADDSIAPAADIVVTARRSSEKLQDVPVAIQAIGGDALSKLAITSSDEISKIAPGLTLVNAGASTKVTLRGVTWTPGSGTPATPIYFNDAPFDPGQTIVSLFDIGQIEVLKGPQGTSRGAPSISGAVTLTTKKPDLTEFGGFVQGQYGEAQHFDIQAGFNAPIIKDMLAIRLATNIENSQGDRVFSINSKVKPKVNDRSYRATVLFKPTDTISIQAMYQRRITDKIRYDQVVGSGSPGAAASPLAVFGGLGAIPANFNGPALTIDQRKSVEDGGNLTFDRVDLFTINATWDVFGHEIAYNYGRQYNKSPSSFNARDPLNMLPGYEPYAEVPGPGTPGFPSSFFQTNEIRISSKRNPDRPFDYDIGWFSKHSTGQAAQNLFQYLPGSFGAPNALPGTGTFNSAYALPVALTFPIAQVFDSFYGNVRFHIGQHTELSGGLAIIRDRAPVDSNTVTGAALANAGPLAVIKLQFPAFLQPLVTSCEAVNAFKPSGLFTSKNYAGTCDVNVPAGSGNNFLKTNPRYTAALYNFSLSHKFSDAILVYATTGSSYRSGLPALGSVGLDPSLLIPKPETAKSYEIGVKTTPTRNVHINASIFQIDYKDQLTSFQNVTYFNTVSQKADLTSLAFFRNIDSRVRGFEVEIATRPLNNLSLGANIAYSQIKSKGGLVPANPGACATAVAVTAANFINFCPSPAGQVLNQDSPFQATANGSYDVPIGPVNGYFRFNLAYRGKNPNFGNFNTGGVFKPVPAFAILDLFAGIAGQKGVWDLGVYAKNVFDKRVELGRVTPPNNIYSPYTAAPGGYDQVRVSLPREIGVTLRYAFGSR